MGYGGVCTFNVLKTHPAFFIRDTEYRPNSMTCITTVMNGSMDRKLMTSGSM